MCNSFKITSGVAFPFAYFLKGNNVPSICEIKNKAEFYFTINIPQDEIPSSEVPVLLETRCKGNLPLIDNFLKEITPTDILENKKYVVTPNCVSGILFGQVLNA